MKILFNVCARRTVPLIDLHLQEVFVLENYPIEAEDAAEALEEFYWHAPIMDHSHFDVSCVKG